MNEPKYPDVEVQLSGLAGLRRKVRAKNSFWLDGGYDRDLVEACRFHPNHHWWTFRLGDVVEHCYDPDAVMTICRGCYVPRCGSTEYDTYETRCDLPRHHEEAHRNAKGRFLGLVGGYSA